MAFSRAGALYTQTVTDTAGGIGAANIPAAARYAEGFVRSASVVETRDGTTPTATLGKEWNLRDIIICRSRDEINSISLIRLAGTSATINWEFFTEPPGLSIG